MKRTILFYFLCIFCMETIFSESLIKIPKTNRVNIKTINTVENSEKNATIYNEQNYPRISKEKKILINCINFYDQNEKLLISCDKMEINNFKCNSNSNVFLCLKYDDLYKPENKNFLYLFDFVKGVQELIDLDVNKYLLSNDGKTIYYITNFNYKEGQSFDFTIFENQQRKTQTINYKNYTREICDGVMIKLEDEKVSLYLYQDACVIVKLFINSDCKVANFALPKYDENTGFSFIINPDESIEYLGN